MKDFFKFTLATIAGIIVSSVLLFFIGILLFFSILSSSESETQVDKDSVMMLKLNGTLSERSQSTPFDFLLKDLADNYGLNDILASIRKAKENEHIKGIYIEAGLLNSGISSLEEIRNALTDFKKSGKFIVAYGDTYSQGLYYLSSVADKVLLNPQGMIEWKGLASTPIFYKDLLDKIGVEMQIFKVGTYKSAVEPWISNEMSDANREQINTYLTDAWGKMTHDVAASRHMDAEELNKLANRMRMFHPAEESVKCGLADTLIYKNDVRDYLKRLMGLDEEDALSVLGLQDMINVKKNVPKDKSGNIVAVYYLEGTIISEQSSVGENEINADEVIKDLRKLQKDENVKAVVLRVNSPGGSAYGSEQIWYAVSQLKKEKPVIVSMGDYAASGGYYISCNADSIVAEPTTVTGSIGIYGMVPNAEKVTEKIGIHFDVVKTNEYADFGVLTRPMSEGEKGLMQAYVNQGYDLFLTRCAEGRQMAKEEINKIGQGHIWSGITAKEIGLVDELGGLDKAIEMAVAKAKIDAYTLTSYPGKTGFLESLTNSTPDNYIKARLNRSKMKTLYQQFNILENMQERDRIQARMPFDINIQ